jgi:hypothetical protein
MIMMMMTDDALNLDLLTDAVFFNLSVAVENKCTFLFSLFSFFNFRLSYEHSSGKVRVACWCVGGTSFYMPVSHQIVGCDG